MVLTRPQREILVVEDDPMMARAMRRALSAWDAEVVSDGPTALEQLEAADYALILCDLQMPTLSGVEVFMRAVAVRPELGPRFVFLSGGGHVDKYEDFFTEAERAVLSKPFTPEQLQAVLDRFGLTKPEPQT